MIFSSIKGTDLSPQSGFLHCFAEKEVFVRRWNESSGQFEKVDPIVNQNIRTAENLKNLDRNLAPYPYDSYKRWCGLSSNITSTDLTRLLPKCGFIDAIVDYEPKVRQIINMFDGHKYAVFRTYRKIWPTKLFY